MNKMISYCGLDCIECPVYLATQVDDDAKRQKVAERWSKLFGMQLKKEDINCDGCTSKTDRLFGHCLNCGIKKCGQDKGVENCAHCDDYKCEQLSTFHKFIPNPQASKNLEERRKGMQERHT